MLYYIAKVIAYTMIVPWSFLTAMYAAEIFAIAFNLQRPSFTFTKKNTVTLGLWYPGVLFFIEGVLLGVILYGFTTIS